MQTYDAVVLFIKSRQAKGLSFWTIKWYREILTSFSREYIELPTRPEPIEDFLAGLIVNDERRHGYYRALKVFYRFLKRRWNIPNPIELIDPPKRKPKKPKPLWPEELNNLFNQPLERRIKAALLFLVDTGARLGELIGLMPEDLVETSWGYIASIEGKTGSRLVPINYETYHALIIALPFPYSKDWLGRKITEAFRNAGLKGSAHQLRHTFATYWEGDELILQRILGHSTLATTKIYRELRVRKIVEQHRKYSPLSTILTGQKNML